ncbi:MAG: hypothetical protein EPN17_17865 [Methylobacter sp.]|nr:MAG: hypothetical protein EPN17_17865 [Methylobacter sp.]
MNELKAIEEINGEINNIVSVAESIRLIATNAKREAAQADINTGGFSLVERELQTFSEKTASALQSLSTLINWQVEVNASKHQRAQNKDCPAYATDVDEIEQLIAAQACELQVRMMFSAKQCATGLLIARTVDREATDDSGMTPELHLVTQYAEKVVENVVQGIKKLELRLAELGLWEKQLYPLSSESTGQDSQEISPQDNFKLKARCI